MVIEAAIEPSPFAHSRTLYDILRGPLSLLRPTGGDPRPLTSQEQAKHSSRAREQTTTGTTRTPTETTSSLSTMSTTTSTSLWTAPEQPIFNNWESLTPVDEFYQHEQRYEQWYRDLHAQDEAQRHSMLLLAALNRHEQSPTLPKCMTVGDVALISTPTPSPIAEEEDKALQDYEDMRAAVMVVRNRRRAKTI